MSQLDVLISDSNLAWDSVTIKDLVYETRLSDKSQEVINFLASDPSNIDSFDSESSESNALSLEMKTIRANFLDEGPGFVIIKSFLKPENENLEGAKNTILYISSILGRPIQQNATGLMVKEVKDRNLSYTDDTTSRYSDNKHGGNYHTDGAEIPPPIPEYLPLLCIRPAKTGGAFKLISSYNVHNKLLEKDKKVLERLYKDFVWDRRGDLGPNGEEVFKKPIFSYQEGKLIFAYLRRYIEDGYGKTGEPFRVQDLAALDRLDSVIYDAKNIFEETLESGDLMISVNSRTIHGRDSYEDYRDKTGMIIKNKQRLLLRTWVVTET